MVSRGIGQADRLLVFYIASLVVFGMLALISASTPVGYTKFHDAYFFVKRQLLFGVVPGIIFFIFIAKMRYEWWERSAWLVYGVTLLLLVLVFIPGIGTSLNGSHSWLSLGNFNIQPAEFAKLGLIIIAARILSERRSTWEHWQESLLPVVAVAAPSLLLIVAQPDVGTLSIMVMIIFMILIVAEVPWQYLALLGGIGVMVFIALVAAAPYRTQRLTTFLHPELDPQGVGYHINQAFLAVGSGGFWGLGYGHSRQKFQYLPEVSADSIYAVVAEENGFLIAAGLVVLILLVGWRGLKIAKYAPSDFARFTVTGIVVWIVWQSFLNIGAMVGVLPLTGVPLPFISHGGTALIAVLVAMGIVVNISKSTKTS